MNKKTHIILLAVLACAAYFNSLPNAFISDDIPAIAGGANIGKLSYVASQPMFFLRPLLYYGIAGIFGKTAIFFRLLNIIFHLGTVLAAYLLIRRLHNPAAAFFSAAIFAVHPLGIEAVGWISGGPYSQSGFFLLMSLLFFASRKENGPFYAFSVVMFIMALASSVTALAFPFILAAFIASFGKIREDWKNLIPFFVLGIIWACTGASQINNRYAILASEYSQKTEWLNPLIQIPFAVTSYLQLIFWPAGLTLYHSETLMSRAAYLARAGLFIIFIAAAAYLFKRNRKLFFWPAFFIICLMPMLNPLGISSVVAERYAYLASLGICALTGLALARISTIKRSRLAAYIIFIAIVSALLTRTMIRNADWKNEDSLWIATVRVSPSSPNAHNNMGDFYSRRGNLDNAVKEFIRAIELKPGYADAWHNLGSAYLAMGKLKEAEGAYKKAVALKPGLWQSYQDLSVLYFRSNNLVASRDNAIKAAGLNPSSRELRHNLAVIESGLKEVKTR